MATQVDRVEDGKGTLLSEVVVERDTSAEMNGNTLRQQAASALASNRTYVALAGPTAAQTTAQVKALARQMNGLIRLMLGQLDGTD